MLQQKLFQRFLHAILIAAQLLGFWPYNLSFDETSFKPSKLSYIYSLVLFTVINVGYLFYFRNLYTFFLMIFKSEGARITIMYGVACISITTFLIYPIHLVKLNSLNGIFVKMKRLMQKLNEDIAMEGVSYSTELLQFATKTFGISAVQTYLSLTKLREDPGSMFFGNIMPDLIITFMANSFYGILLIIFVYLKQMNRSIYNVTDLAAELQESDKKRLEKIETFCRLSDRLNELAMYRYRLCDLTRELCGIFVFNTNGWIVLRVCLTFIQLFVIYIMIVLVVFREETGHLRTVNITVVQVILTVADLLFMSKTYNDVNNEKLTPTKKILKDYLQQFRQTRYKINLLSSTSDKSYIQNLELLSLQTIQFKLDLSGCGMYNMDFTLMFSIFTFVVATWLILIQFEVTEFQRTLEH